MNVVYLCLSGVLHPSRSLFKLLHNVDFEQAGHSKYENVSVLAKALKGYPDARIMLTTTEPWNTGLEQTKAALGDLAERVMGSTFEDLTTKVPWRTPSGKPRDEMDYGRMDRSRIVDAHAEWLKPSGGWVVIDHEDILWSDDVREERLVLTPPTKGLQDPEAQSRLAKVLRQNFGPPSFSSRGTLG